MSNGATGTAKGTSRQASGALFRPGHLCILFVITESLLATPEVLLLGPHFQWWSIAIPIIFFLVVMVIFALLIRNITSRTTE